MSTKTSLREQFLAEVERQFFVQVESDGPVDYIAGTDGEVTVIWNLGPKGDYWQYTTAQEVRLHVGGRLVSTSITEVLTTAREWVAGCTELRPTQAAAVRR